MRYLFGVQAPGKPLIEAPEATPDYCDRDLFVMRFGNFILPEMQTMRRSCIPRMGISVVFGKAKPAHRTMNF